MGFREVVCFFLGFDHSPSHEYVFNVNVDKIAVLTIELDLLLAIYNVIEMMVCFECIMN